MKTQSRAFRTRFTFQQDNGPKHTARVAYTQHCECPWVAQPQPELEPNQIFLENPENVHLPPSNLTACRIKQKTWGYKGTSAKYLVKGMNTYAMHFFYL